MKAKPKNRTMSQVANEDYLIGYNHCVEDMNAWLEDKVVIRRSELSENKIHEIIRAIRGELQHDKCVAVPEYVGDVPIAKAILTHIEAKGEK